MYYNRIDHWNLNGLLPPANREFRVRTSSFTQLPHDLPAYRRLIKLILPFRQLFGLYLSHN